MSVARQRGQSLVEAMLGLAVLGAFAAGVHATGRWHDLSIQSLTRSATTGFLRTLGQPPDAGTRLDRDADRFAPVGPIRTLMTEWQVGVGGIVVGSSGTDGVAIAARLPAWVPAPWIARHTYLHGGTGHGRSDAQVQSHTASSAMAWSDAAGGSSELIRQAAKRIERVDSPWRRPVPDTDWLVRWTGFVPAGLLRKSPQ